MSAPCRLYLITPSVFQLANFTEQVKAAFDGGDIACLQLRMKEASQDEVLNAGETLLPLCKQYDIPLIINDYADIALKLGAGGVHIGFDGIKEPEGMIASLRKSCGKDMIIGASCYDSADLAMIAGNEEADYVSFGAFYPTKTKESPGKPTPELLEWWSTYTVVPCVAIGGITPENCAPLVTAGADFIAVVSNVWEHEKGANIAVKELNTAIEMAIAKKEQNR